MKKKLYTCVFQFAGSLEQFVEDQAMVTEFKGEDTDPPVNAVTRIAEDQDSDPPVIEAATTYPP
jgi:hypothetical protein